MSVRKNFMQRRLIVFALLVSLVSPAIFSRVVLAQSPATAQQPSRQQTSPPAAQQRQLTIDDIYDPERRINFSGSPPTNLFWLRDGTHYLQSRREQGQWQLLRVNALTGTSEPFHDAARMEAALGRAGITAQDARTLARLPAYQMNPTQTAALINHNDDLYYYEWNSDRAVRLTNTREAEEVEDFSPDGRMVAFVRGNNLYVVEVASQRERQLTTDGAEKILNGKLDWVYQEELYGRGNFKGFWWSPDSGQIAFLRLDETPVREFTLVDHLSRLQEIETTPYPKAGDPNPTVQLRVVAATGGASRQMDTGRYTDFLISRVEWTPDSREVTHQVQNREQTWLDLNFANAQTGAARTAFRETSRAWVEVIDNPMWLADGSFLWQSDRTGWRHLYHYNRDGRLIRPVTSGQWEVRTVHGTDPVRRRIYFSGTERSHIGSDAYRINLDGTGLTRLTERAGTHRAEFNPTFTHFIDYWSDVNTPTQVRLFTTEGREARVIDENRVAAVNQFRLGRTEFMQVRTRDGFTMEAQMIRPPDFDPSRRYPVMIYQYSGPQAPVVRNAWGGTTYMWHQLLAQRGYIVWMCDARSASGKGVEPAWTVHRNLGEGELRDIEDGVAFLRSQNYVDPQRIGIWGWSYGGYMTSYALTHSQSFRIGIAGGSVTDWRLYDTIYTERLMGTPQNNEAGYTRSAPLRRAANLHGKLLLIHGTMDDNVHMQNTIQFAMELQRAGKQFELMLYPRARHGVTNPLQLKHMRQLMTDFIIENL
jgi:dipeptidyl-peptidase 4